LAVGVIATTPIPSEAVFVLALGWIGAIVLRMPQAEWERTGDFAAHKLSDFVARRQLHCLEIHAEFFRPNGVEYELEVGLPAPPWHTKVVGFDSGSRDFGERDRLLLDLLRPHLVSSYESAKTRRLAAALAAGAQASGELVMLDSAARIKFASVSARRLLRDYCDDADRTRLPQAVEDWFLHDRRRLNSDSLPPRGNPLTIDCEHGRLVVTRMNGDNECCPWWKNRFPPLIRSCSRGGSGRSSPSSSRASRMRRSRQAYGSRQERRARTSKTSTRSWECTVGPPRSHVFVS
jgi:hypothetical protein